jgi:hypothetical protein
MALADFIKVQKFLGGIRYPATKQQLVDQARGNQADDDALTALSGMPEREYSGPDEVSRAIPEAGPRRSPEYRGLTGLPGRALRRYPPSRGRSRSRSHSPLLLGSAGQARSGRRRPGIAAFLAHR